jgi:hypothetical protein
LTIIVSNLAHGTFQATPTYPHHDEAKLVRLAQPPFRPRIQHDARLDAEELALQE